jgi:hypothetical protein
MSSRRVQCVLLVEDKQQEVFLTRLLRQLGVTGSLRTVPYPCGRGSGAAHVRDHFAEEVKAHRRFAKQRADGLLVALDADTRTVDECHRDLQRALNASGERPRDSEEPIVLLVPKRAIETWIQYLNGTRPVDEETRYPHLAHERDCAPAVTALVQRMREQGVAPDCLPSLARVLQSELPRLQ